MVKIISRKQIAHHVILVVFSLIAVIPLGFVLLGMTHGSEFVFNTVSKLYIGNSFTLNLRVLNDNFNVVRVLLNSLGVSFFNALIGVIMMFFAGYSFAIYDFKGKRILFVICLIVMMIPGNVIIINKYKVVSSLELTNTYIGLILPTAINIHVLLLFIRNFEYINKETIESARIDGASEFQIMLSIGFPAVLSYVVIGFFNMFVQCWNNFLLPLLITNSEDYFTLPIMISSIADPLRFKFGAVFVGLFLLMSPVVILLIFVSKRLFRKIN